LVAGSGWRHGLGRVWAGAPRDGNCRTPSVRGGKRQFPKACGRRWAYAALVTVGPCARWIPARAILTARSVASANQLLRRARACDELPVCMDPWGQGRSCLRVNRSPATMNFANRKERSRRRDNFWEMPAEPRGAERSVFLERHCSGLEKLFSIVWYALCRFLGPTRFRHPNARKNALRILFARSFDSALREDFHRHHVPRPMAIGEESPHEPRGRRHLARTFPGGQFPSA